MKKLLTLLVFILFMANGALAFEDIQVVEPVTKTETAEVKTPEIPDVKFDWLDLTKEQRINVLNDFGSVVFNDDSKIRLTKQEFNSQLAKYKKDKEFKHHYMLTNNGVTDDEDAKYNPFYYKKDTLVIYAIQYKNDIHHSLYYTPYGKLYYVDITSDNYPNYPYYSMQYNRKGVLKSAIYFVSPDIQYMFNGEQEFVGVWYKDKLYDIDGKQISTREGW